MKPRKILEKHIKSQIKDYLNIKGYFHFHLMAGMGSYIGAPDRIAVKNSKVWFIEVKSPTGTQKDTQLSFQNRLQSAGGTYVLARSVEDLIQAGVI